MNNKQEYLYYKKMYMKKKELSGGFDVIDAVIGKHIISNNHCGCVKDIFVSNKKKPIDEGCRCNSDCESKYCQRRHSPDGGLLIRCKYGKCTEKGFMQKSACGILWRGCFFCEPHDTG